MRTTINLPEPLHAIALSLAQHTGRSLSQAVAELMQRGLDAPVAARQKGGFKRHALTGLLVVQSSRIITAGDVAALEDES